MQFGSCIHYRNYSLKCNRDIDQMYVSICTHKNLNLKNLFIIGLTSVIKLIVNEIKLHKQ